MKSAENGSPCKITHNDEFKPGKALFSMVYKDLESNKSKFMDRRSLLTPGLALFSVLTAVNNQRLRVSEKPTHENDFEIVQLKNVGN